MGKFKEHDRYLPYHMLGKQVSFQYKDKLIEGIVSDVTRDIFSNEVVIKIGSKDYRFREPNSIHQREDGNIAFLYGVKKPDTDKGTFDEIRDRQYHGSIGDAMADLGHDAIVEHVFGVGASLPKKRRGRKFKGHKPTQ